MKRTINRIFSIVLVGCFALCVLMIMPHTAKAADVTINDSMSVNDIKDVIDAKIAVLPPTGGVITVDGSKTIGIDATLYLAIPEGVTIEWGAVYACLAALPFNLIELQGDGTFEVVIGSAIENTGEYHHAISVPSGNLAIKVSGGQVKNSGHNGTAIFNYSGTVIVSGGMIEGNRHAIEVPFGNIIISDGAVKAEIGDGVCAADVTVSGGTIESTGGLGIFALDVLVEGDTALITSKTSYALGTGDGMIKVIGGTVLALAANPIWVDGMSVLRTSVAAYLKGTCVGGYSDEHGICGLVVEVDSLSIPQSWIGTNRGLKIKTGSNSVKWGQNGQQPIIIFKLANGSTRSMDWGMLVASSSNNTNSNSNSSSGYFPSNLQPSSNSQLPYFQPVQRQQTYGKGITDVKRAPVYNSTGRSKKVISRLTRGTSFTIIGIDGDYYIVNVEGGEIGYIPMSSCNTTFNESGTALRKIWCYSRMNAKTKYRAVQFGKGDEIEVVGRYGKWYVLKFNDEIAFIEAKCVRLS